jgi:hypothetical protein
MKQDKRILRELKREVKRAGNKRRRQFLKRQLEDQPEEAPYAEFDFGRDSSAGFNAMDQDAKRKKKTEDRK